MTHSIRIAVLSAAVLAALATSALAQPIGSAFTYQGRLTSGGTPITASSDLSFSLWTAQTGGSPVGTPVMATLTPDDGLFTASLDFGVNAWNGNARWLQIDVRSPSGGIGPYTTLTPRQPVSPAPYSVQTRGIYVDASNNVGLGTTNPLSPLSFPSVVGEKIRLWGTGAGHFGMGVQGSLLQIYSATATADIALGWGSSSAFNEKMRVTGSGRVGIGTSTPQNPLHVVGNGDTFALEGTNHSYMEFFPQGQAAGRKGYFGYGTAGSDVFQLNNQATNGVISLMTSGNVGIGTTSPTYKLHVAGSARATSLEITGEITLPDGGIRRGGGTPATSDLGLYSLTAGNWLRLVSNSSPIQFFTNSAQGTSSSPAANSAAMTIAANGNVGIGTHSPAQKLHVMGPIRMENGGVSLDLTTGAAVDMRPNTDLYINTPLVNRILLQTEGGSVGIGTNSPQGRLDVAGIARVDMLQIDAGADVAENYDIAPAMKDGLAWDVRPGMVVSIDPREIGKLVVTSQSYDRRVAGVVSGAGDVKPGLVLSQPGTVADGEHPVASMGRVWCLVDADVGGPVEAGDLLTTSNTPGHAMRAGDAVRAPGATIGKAMSPLTEGRGLVLVLVSLQ